MVNRRSGLTVATVYVPVYQPTVVYGTWGYPAYPPYYWAPPPYYYPPSSGAFARRRSASSRRACSNWRPWSVFRCGR